MQNLEKISQELQRGGKGEQLKTLAASADGKKLCHMANRSALAEAARKGDTETLRSIISQLLTTAEGQRLSGEIQKMLRDKGHG